MIFCWNIQVLKYRMILNEPNINTEDSRRVRKQNGFDTTTERMGHEPRAPQPWPNALIPYTTVDVGRRKGRLNSWCG